MGLLPEEEVVLNIFKAYEIEPGEYLSVQTLDRERMKVPRRIQENWDILLKSLVKEGYTIRDLLGYGLTEKGHHQLRDSE